MATNIVEWASAGLHCVQIGARDANGLFTGFGKLDASDAGEVSGMRHIQGSVTAPSPEPTVNRVYARDDDRYHGAFIFDGQPNEFGLEFEATDLDVAAFVAKKSLYTWATIYEVLNSGNSNRQFQDSILLLTRQAQSYEAASDGSPGYDNLLIHSAKFTRNRGNAAFQSVGNNMLNGIATPVQTTFFGGSILSLLGDSDGLTWEFWSEFVPTLFCFVGDGAEDEIALPYTPISTAKTIVYNGSTGAALTVSSVNASADTAKLSAAPSNGVICPGIFETPDL